MSAPRNLKAYVAAAAALAILFLAAGMLFAIERLDRVAATQIAHIRAQSEQLLREPTLQAMYAQGEQERRRLRTQLYGFLAASLVLALTATIHFARLLGNDLRAEHHAVEAARRAVVSRDDLMGVVAHDLRTPLHAIGLRALLIEKIATMQTVQEQAQSIATIVRTMEKLIQTMLDVASIQAGRFSVTPALCDVHQIVRDCVGMLDPVANAQGVRLRQRIAPCELTMIADRERVLQVLVNLVGNAIKFSHAGTEVCLQVEPCADEIAFAVVDQGPGIPPVNLPNVFDRFWKRQPDAKTGSGLGLFIARNIVVAHGGRIWAESDGVRGTTFRFVLPRVGAGAPKARGPLLNPNPESHQLANER